MSSRSSNYKGRNNNSNKRSGGTPNFGSSSSAYFINEQVKRDVGSFNWAYPIGLPYPQAVDYNDDSINHAFSTPLVQIFNVQPTIGISKNANSATHLQSLTMFNYIVRINSRNVAYEPVDLTLALVALNSVYSFISWCGRIYQIANSYSAMNRAVPDMLLRANNVSPDSITKHVEDFRAWLNIYSNKAGLLAFPKGIPFFDRSVELYSNIYADENSERAQIYMFVPDVFYKYDEMQEEGGRLVPLPMWYSAVGTGFDTTYKQFFTDNAGTTQWNTRGYWTFEDIKALGDELLDPLLGSEDISHICSDIYKAYGSNNLISLPMMPENSSIVAKHDYDMLQQIENMKIIDRAQIWNMGGSAPTSVGVHFPVMAQDPSLNRGNLLFSYYTNSGYAYSQNSQKAAYYDKLMTRDKVLNVHGDADIGPDAIMNMTRLVPALKRHDVYPALQVTQCGTELIVGSRYYSYEYTEANLSNRTVAMTEGFKYALSSSSVTTSRAMQLFARRSQWNYSPEVNYIMLDGSDMGMSMQFYDLDKFVSISNSEISKLHDVALLGLFRTPGYTSSIRQ